MAPGDTAATRALLEARCNCNVRIARGCADSTNAAGGANGFNDVGATPLWMASAAGHVACVALLLAEGEARCDLTSARPERLHLADTCRARRIVAFATQSILMR